MISPGRTTPAIHGSKYTSISCKPRKYQGALEGFGATEGLAGSSSGACSTIDQITRPTVSRIMQMNSMKTRSGQVKILSSTSLFSNVGSPRAINSSLRTALYMASQRKYPTRKTIMTMGTLSGFATTLLKFGSSRLRQKATMLARSIIRPPDRVHSLLDRRRTKKTTNESVNDHFG